MKRFTIGTPRPVAVSPCPHCEFVATLEALVGDLPPGDELRIASLCAKCGGLSVQEPGGMLRRPTDQELAEIRGSPYAGPALVGLQTLGVKLAGS